MQLCTQNRHLCSYFPSTAWGNLPIPGHQCVDLGTIEAVPADMIFILVGSSGSIILRKVEHHYIVIGIHVFAASWKLRRQLVSVVRAIWWENTACGSIQVVIDWRNRMGMRSVEQALGQSWQERQRNDVLCFYF